MVIIFQQSTHRDGGFFFALWNFHHFLNKKISTGITSNWKLNSAVTKTAPQHIVLQKNIAKNPPVGDKKTYQKVSISTIDFGLVN